MDCLLQNGRTNARLNSVFEDQIHFAVKQRFQEELKIEIAVKGWALELHKEVHIAAFRLLTTGIRPEDPEAANPKAADRLPILFQFLQNLFTGHCFQTSKCFQSPWR